MKGDVTKLSSVLEMFRSCYKILHCVRHELSTTFKQSVPISTEKHCVLYKLALNILKLTCFSVWRKCIPGVHFHSNNYTLNTKNAISINHEFFFITLSEHTRGANNNFNQFVLGIKAADIKNTWKSHNHIIQTDTDLKKTRLLLSTKDL